ncbi:MAG: NAD(P)H-binding protein, partial [Micromonosporaceae bacterium]
MRVVIAGGHGQIARAASRLLVARGDDVVGLIRNPEHEVALRELGVWPQVCDLERAGLGEVAVTVEGSDAVVFAAGAGPGSGAARKDTVDRAAAGLLAEAAQRAGVRRYLLISAMALERGDRLPAGDVFGAYLRAKAASEAELRRRPLDWTILRPGRLTDAPGT